jgi:flavin-dependent dehydrogenase
MSRAEPIRSAADVVVIGGGPAGATTAALVAEKGHDVVLLERSPRPAFKVGESLMPASWWTLERLGLLAAMRDSAFPVKQSVQFFSSSGRGSVPFYFSSTDSHESSRTWQVLRSDFDRLLLDNARDKGTRVRFGDRVRKVRFEGERAVGVALRTADGADEEISARVVVDASGQRTLLAEQLGIKRTHREMRNASCYTHFEGARRDEGIDAGATLIFATARRDSWFWFIPLPGDRVSVGVVGSIDYLIRGRRGDPQRIFEQELALCPALQTRLEDARQVRDVKVARDFSYRAERMAGDGWVLVGDAWGFVDPIYSAGVFLALESGARAADCIVGGLAEGDLSGERLGAFGDDFERGVEAIEQLIFAFYDKGFSFARFLERYPECREEIVHILIGNVFRRPVGALFGPLEEFRRSAREPSQSAAR